MTSRATPSAGRAWVWLQLAGAWLPMWAFFSAVIVIVHGSSVHSAMVAALRMVLPGALLGVVVYRLAARTPWPHPFRFGFVALHVGASLAYAGIWYLLVSAIDSVLAGQLRPMVGPGFGLFMLTGLCLYAIVAGVAYANLAARRSAELQAQAARAQLDALRAQLHPHFLFNALHTVVQLIPTDPRGAVRAAEQLAAALRTAIEERRDQVTLREEWTFVERYLALEGIRFGTRLRVQAVIAPEAEQMLLPSFALQTLVENAVRHGAAPRVEPTTLSIAARRDGATLLLDVRDDGIGADPAAIEQASGSGLRRLRERLRWLYGDGAELRIAGAPGAGCHATLRVPQHGDD